MPGLNSVIKSVVYRATENQCEVIGIRKGWEGLTHCSLDDPASKARHIWPLDRANTRTIDRSGGTVLHTSRISPSRIRCTAPGFLDTRLRYAAWRSSYCSRASSGVRYASFSRRQHWL